MRVEIVATERLRRGDRVAAFAGAPFQRIVSIRRVSHNGRDCVLVRTSDDQRHPIERDHYVGERHTWIRRVVARC